MARGWESKAVEGQVQERESREDRQNKRQVTQDEVEVRRQRGILMLSRARVEIQFRLGAWRSKKVEGPLQGP